MMRTTVNLPDDVFQAARSLAHLRKVSLGEALAELVRQGLNPHVSIDVQKPFPCFVLRQGASPITLDQTLEAEDLL